MTTSSIAERQITLDKKDDVFVITFTGSPNKANVFNIPLLKRLNALLDKVESSCSLTTPCALIVTGAGGFFSAGFDLKALTGKSLSEQQGSGSMSKPNPQGAELVQLSWRVLARLLVFPVPTVAVFNGHAYGLGFFIGLACDHRIMLKSNKKKAFLCLPEITIGLELGIGFAALAKCKLSIQALRDSLLTGKQWTCHEAKTCGLIDACVPKPTTTTDETDDDKLLLSLVPPEAFHLAQQLVSTSAKGNLGPIKMQIYEDTYSVMCQAKAKL